MLLLHVRAVASSLVNAGNFFYLHINVVCIILALRAQLMHDVGFIFHSYNVDISLTPIGSIIRQQVMCELKRKYKPVSGAEDALGVTVEPYMEESPGHPAPGDSQPLSVSPALFGKMRSLTASQISDLVVEGLVSLGHGRRGDSFVSVITGILFNLFEQKEFVDVIAILDKLYTWVACKKGIASNPRSFIQLCLGAMKRLEDNNNVNLVFKFCQGLALDRPDKSGPLIPIHRMPFGLMQYCIEFFICKNVMQVTTQSVPSHKWDMFVISGRVKMLNQ